VSHAQHHKHSYYLIRNSDRLLGLTDHEIEMIALIVRYHRKSSPKNGHPEFAALSSDDQAVVRLCAGLLRVAIGLDRGHNGNVARVDAAVRRRRLCITAVPATGADISLELYAADERKGLLEEALGMPVEIQAG
jgi:exopolyphosphatase/guanosine-5'-triphosphate,3'-diphosphate pyrophosphatase